MMVGNNDYDAVAVKMMLLQLFKVPFDLLVCVVARA